MRYLVDSDWVINYIGNHRATHERLSELYDEGIGLSVLCVAEVYEGVLNSRTREADEIAFDQFLAKVEIVDIDLETAYIAGRERARLRGAQPPVGDFDVAIGATALRHGLVMLTNNRKDFGRIEGLTIESV